MGVMLKVNDLHVYYGSIHAVKGVSFEVNEGEVVTLIGANGAGKSTVLNTDLRPAASTVAGRHLPYEGTDPIRACRRLQAGAPRGLAQVPEGLCASSCR